MKIVSVDIPASGGGNLRDIRMDKLGSIVVIAGRNGAGKSRLLSKIADWGFNFAKKKRNISKIPQYEHAILRLAGDNKKEMERELATFKLQRVKYEQIVADSDGIVNIISFVPTKLDVRDPSSMTKNEAIQAENNLSAPGVSHLPDGAFALIQNCQNRYREASHPIKIGPEEKAEEAIKSYERLREIVRKFLNTEITRSIDGDAELFGLALGSTGLSAGQKVLLQLCIAIYTQGKSLNNLIVLMDEPENHLHPGALLDLIEAFTAHLADGQLWIATHSIPLLAEVPSSSIWWMQDGAITKAGGNPEKVLEGLLGDETRRGRLATFLDLPFAMASSRFAAECLTPPLTVAHQEKDPQVAQIFDVLSHLTAGGEKIRILDFGAGKGRLASELAESWPENRRSLVDYIAYDVSRDDADTCLAAISQLVGTSENRLFHDVASLKAKYDEGSFDVVVMCNVLHEIPPSMWGDLFGSEGKITRLLKLEGYLLLVEVQQLPYGEKAHQNGFCVLDSAQLKKLFSIKEADAITGFSVKEAKDGWLKAHLIAQPLVARYSGENRKLALDDLCSTSRDQIRELRGKISNYRNGRLHGFWVQQFANAQLVLLESR